MKFDTEDPISTSGLRAGGIKTVEGSIRDLRPKPEAVKQAVPAIPLLPQSAIQACFAL